MTVILACQTMHPQNSTVRDFFGHKIM